MPGPSPGLGCTRVRPPAAARSRDRADSLRGRRSPRCSARTIAEDVVEGSTALNLGAVALTTLPLAWRRQAPFVVAVVVLGAFAGRALAGPPLEIYPPLWRALVAIYSVAAYGTAARRAGRVRPARARAGRGRRPRLGRGRRARPRPVADPRRAACWPSASRGRAARSRPRRRARGRRRRSRPRSASVSLANCTTRSRTAWRRSSCRPAVRRTCIAAIPAARRPRSRRSSARPARVWARCAGCSGCSVTAGAARAAARHSRGSTELRRRRPRGRPRRAGGRRGRAAAACPRRSICRPTASCRRRSPTR